MEAASLALSFLLEAAEGMTSPTARCSILQHWKKLHIHYGTALFFLSVFCAWGCCFTTQLKLNQLRQEGRTDGRQGSSFTRSVARSPKDH